MRAFLALNLPDDAHAALLQRMQALQARTKHETLKLRWVRPEQLHLTLRFFKDISEEQRDAAVQAIHSAVEGQRALPTQAGPLGVFPGWRRPRVLWAGMESPDHGLQALFSRLDNAFFDAGLDRSDKSTFHPHITLARLKHGPHRLFAHLLQDEAQQPWGVDYALTTLTLYQSELQPTGAIHTPLAQWTFPL